MPMIRTYYPPIVMQRPAVRDEPARVLSLAEAARRRREIASRRANLIGFPVTYGWTGAGYGIVPKT